MVITKPLTALAALLLALALTACPNLPPPERVDLGTDLRVLRGDYEGYVDTRDWPYVMALNPDASALAATWQGVIELWDLATMEVATTIAVPTADSDVRYRPSFNASGSLISAASDGRALVWETDTGALVLDLDPSARLSDCRYCRVYQTSLSPSGDKLAVSGSVPAVLLIDVATGQIERELEILGWDVALVGFSADGTLLASASYTRGNNYGYSLRVWSATDFNIVFEHEGSVDPHIIPHFAFSGDGRRLAVRSELKLEIFDILGGHEEFVLAESADAWLGALNHDGSLAAMHQGGNFDSFIAIVDLTTGETVERFEDTLGGSPGWSADGSAFVAGSRLVDTSDFAVMHDFSVGQLHELELVAVPQYLDPVSYAVSGSVSIDGAMPIDFSGIVKGHESQRYLRPQARAPRAAELEFQLDSHPWRFYAHQQHGDFDWSLDPIGTWRGGVTEGSGSWYEFKLWRVP